MRQRREKLVLVFFQGYISLNTIFFIIDNNNFLMRHIFFSAFVKSEMKDNWGNKVKVKQVRGTLPTILLKSADGRTQRTLNVMPFVLFLKYKIQLNKKCNILD